MLVGFDAPEDRADATVRADDERGPLRPHEDVASHVLFHPDAVVLDDFASVIAEQRERQAKFVDESAVAFERVGAHTENCRVEVLEIRPAVAQPARLHGAAGRVVLGIEIEHDMFAAEILQAHLRAGAIRSAESQGCKRGGGISNFQFGGHRLMRCSAKGSDCGKITGLRAGTNHAVHSVRP